ncbi:MAG TPA: phosphatidylglycerol lysyltransferase domain-containing protein [Candidatus Sulfotelmatobacter sp.]|jgi:lysylphosphatidylglycerol synthetase-like protein (DUF2156 family)|nr:phosphatidylglycerol lysyltransferase domain-containing protein [Candidatus Sulfotelmatobacter sp.]
MEKMGNNINAAQLLMENYGKDTLSYFALHEKKKFFFSSTGHSFLSYTIRGKIALVSGDPIGPITEISLLLKEFEYFIRGANLSSCFLVVNKETLQNLVELGHRQFHIGSEAIITLSNFEKSSLKKKVRRAERYILNQGIVCKIYKRKEIPLKYLNQLDSVAKEWIQYKGGKEKRFTMTLGRIPSIVDRDCEIVLALQSEEVIGYLTFVPVYASKSLSLDATRRKKNAPNGLVEFLLIQSLEHFKKQGINTVSLNFATFHHQKKEMSEKPVKLLISLLYIILSRLYKTNNIYHFNNKFLPHWQERYVAFEKKRYLPSYLLAIAKVEL